MMRKMMICFAAGCLGALANSIAVWMSGDLGFTKQLGVSMAPGMTPGWLYPRIVWGGIWGLLFMLPMLRSRPVLKGSILSLFPSMAQLFFFFPYKTHKGMAGLELGLLTPLLVLFFNWIWGVVTAAAERSAR
jgi:hypothetical protein